MSEFEIQDSLEKQTENLPKEKRVYYYTKDEPSDITRTCCGNCIHNMPFGNNYKTATIKGKRITSCWGCACEKSNIFGKPTEWNLSIECGGFYPRYDTQDRVNVWLEKIHTNDFYFSLKKKEELERRKVEKEAREKDELVRKAQEEAARRASLSVLMQKAVSDVKVNTSDDIVSDKDTLQTEMLNDAKATFEKCVKEAVKVEEKGKQDTKEKKVSKSRAKVDKPIKRKREIHFLTEEDLERKPKRTYNKRKKEEKSEVVLKVDNVKTEFLQGKSRRDTGRKKNDNKR